MAKKSKRTRRRRKARGTTNKPIHVVIGDPDGCACPICVEQLASGEPIYTMDENGELVLMERNAAAVVMISVTIRGSASTWPELPATERAVSVPAGCTVDDLLEYLCFRDQPLRLAFPPGTMYATIDGERCHPDQVVMAHEQLTVFGERDATLSRQLADLFAAPPPDDFDA